MLTITQAVYDIPTEHEDTAQNSVYALQRLFYQLQTSEHAVGTNELTKAFGWDTRQIFEQQDVQELSRKLMEILENKVKGTKGEGIVPGIFTGKCKTYISCINVNYESSRVEEFQDIQLKVSGHKDLHSSFEYYIQVEKMDGENQYFAGDEHKLQDANKGAIFTSFPDVLHLQLMRFEYDIERDMMTKVNDRHEFPDAFDAAAYLSDDADKSESWEYQLHGVLVHSGDQNAGHYYAFIKPSKDGWFYKYDDDKVTRATMREVLEENYGGAYVPPASLQARGAAAKKSQIMRTNNAYMLVYIRKSRVDKILSNVEMEDIPLHLRNRFDEENAAREARRKEQREAHLYMTAKVVTNQTFQSYGGTDLCKFDGTADSDEEPPLHYRLLRTMVIEDFVKLIAADLEQDPRRIRLWLMVNRQNKTVRPDQPIMDTRLTVEEVYARSAAQRDVSLRVWVEVATEVNAEGDAVWASYQNASSNPAKEENILLFLKYFDVENQTLNGVSHVYLGKEQKVEDLTPMIHKAMHWPETVGPLLLWEVSTYASFNWQWNSKY